MWVAQSFYSLGMCAYGSISGSAASSFAFQNKKYFPLFVILLTAPTYENSFSCSNGNRGASNPSHPFTRRCLMIVASYHDNFPCVLLLLEM